MGRHLKAHNTSMSRNRLMFRRKLFQPTNHEEIKPFLITFHGCHELVYTVFVNKLRYTRDGHMSDCIGYLVCERRSILCS